MTIRNKLALAIMVAGISSQASAVELGEFNGTAFSIGGYIKAEGIFSNPDDGDGDFDSTTRQSRIGFKASKEVEGHKVTGYIEGDFYGGSGDTGSYDWRLRHGYIQVDNLTIGQTWNGQFFSNAPLDVETLDLRGLGTGTIAGNGAVVRRDTVLHYTMGGVRLTAQDPIYSDADYPDMVVAYTHRTESGHAMNVAVTGREVQTGVDDSEFGAAISVAGKFKFGNTSLALSAYTGEGAAAYSGFGYNGVVGGGVSTADVNAAGDLIETTGFSVGLGQKFSDKLRGNLRYGYVESDEVAVGVAEDNFELFQANLIYTYLPGLDFGIELRDANVTYYPTVATGPDRLAGQQVEVMAMYKF